MNNSSTSPEKIQDLSCIFCKIVHNQLKADILLNEKDYMAFLDIHPHSLGHTLVIPKAHYRWVWDIPEVGEILEVGKRVTQAIQQAFFPSLIAAGIVGDEVPHAHLHIIPRYEKKPRSYSMEEIRSTIQKYLE